MEPVGAVLSLSDAAAAHAAGLVRRASAARPVEIRHRRHVFHRAVLPFLIFCPRRLRFFSAFGILLLQSCILITGNYNWFNLQTMLLCLPLFDDAALRKILPRRLIRLRAVTGGKSDAATGGDGRRQRIGGC